MKGCVTKPNTTKMIKATDRDPDNMEWAVILGGSSGLGLATARKLAIHGYSLIIVHRDRKAHTPQIESDFREIAANGYGFLSYNADATQPGKRAEMIRNISQNLPPGSKIKVLVHSIAKGNLKPMHTQHGLELDHQDFQITIDAMAISLYDWVQALIKEGLLKADFRVISFTSEGSTRAMRNYAAISAAKAALEAITRSIALEFAPLGIKANCIQAGVTETTSLAMIPGNEKIKEQALQRNPHGRLTQPEDVANVAYLLCTEEAKWITGTVIKADGGESLH